MMRPIPWDLPLISCLVYFLKCKRYLKRQLNLMFHRSFVKPVIARIINCKLQMETSILIIYLEICDKYNHWSYRPLTVGSSRPEVCKKGVLKNFEKIHRKTPVADYLFLIQLQAWGLQCYLKRNSGTGVFL